jgi:hypothetical protein
VVAPRRPNPNRGLLLTRASNHHKDHKYPDDFQQNRQTSVTSQLENYNNWLAPFFLSLNTYTTPIIFIIKNKHKILIPSTKWSGNSLRKVWSILIELRVVIKWN